MTIHGPNMHEFSYDGNSIFRSDIKKEPESGWDLNRIMVKGIICPKCGRKKFNKLSCSGCGTPYEAD